MKPLIARRQASRTIVILFSALLISTLITGVGTWASTSIVNSQHQPILQLTGIVSDSDCGSTHGTKIHGDAACTRLCVSLGAEYVLADGTRIYVLRGHPTELNAFAGQMVVVRGKMVKRNVVEVESVDPYFVSAVKN